MRPILVLVALGASVLPNLPALAQPAPVVVSPGNTLLSVNGEGRSYREPDLAVFSAGVTSQGASAAAALSENSRAMTGVNAALKRAGVAERDIQTSNLSINPVYANPEREAMMAARVSGQPYIPPPPETMVPKIVGYQANNTVMVRQRKLGDYGKIIDALASAGANQINGPMFQIEASQAALDEARTSAMKDARRRAELLAATAGLKIVRTVSISDGGGYFAPQPVTMMSRDIVVTGSAPPPPPPPAPMQTGELQMMANVSVQYELAPG